MNTISTYPALVLTSFDDPIGSEALALLEEELKSVPVLRPFVLSLVWNAGTFAPPNERNGRASEREGLTTALETILVGGEPYRRAEVAGVYLKVGQAAVYILGQLDHADAAARLTDLLGQVRRTARENCFALGPVGALLAVPPDFEGNRSLRHAAARLLDAHDGADALWLCSRRTELGQWVPEAAWPRQLVAVLITLICADLGDSDHVANGVFRSGYRVGNGHLPTCTAVGIKCIVHPERRLVDYVADRLSTDLLSDVLLEESASAVDERALARLGAILTRYRRQAPDTAERAAERLRQNLIEWLDDASIGRLPQAERPTELDRRLESIEGAERERLQDEVDRALDDSAKCAAEELEHALIEFIGDRPGGLAQALVLLRRISSDLAQERVSEMPPRPTLTFPEAPGAELRQIWEGAHRLWRNLIWGVLVGIYGLHLGAGLTLPQVWQDRLTRVEPRLVGLMTPSVLLALLGALPFVLYIAGHLLLRRHRERMLLAHCRQSIETFADAYRRFAVATYISRQGQTVVELTNRWRRRQEEWKQVRDDLSRRANDNINGLSAFAWEHLLLSRRQFETTYQKVKRRLKGEELLKRLVDELRRRQPAQRSSLLLSTPPADLADALDAVSHEIAQQLTEVPEIGKLLPTDLQQLDALLTELERDSAPALHQTARAGGPMQTELSTLATPDETLAICDPARERGHLVRRSILPDALALLTVRHGLPLVHATEFAAPVRDTLISVN